MLHVIKYFKQVLQDSDGEYSSKRLVTFLCVLLMTAGYLANLIGGYTVEEFMYESIMYIVIAGLGFTGAEKFAPRPKDKGEE